MFGWFHTRGPRLRSGHLPKQGRAAKFVVNYWLHYGFFFFFLVCFGDCARTRNDLTNAKQACWGRGEVGAILLDHSTKQLCLV